MHIFEALEHLSGTWTSGFPQKMRQQENLSEYQHIAESSWLELALIIPMQIASKMTPFERMMR
jgi:hypothetical protein